MKIDIYTKIVLTVIAACLVVLTLGSVDLLPGAHAAPNRAQSVSQDDSRDETTSGPIDVRIVDIGQFVTVPVKSRQFTPILVTIDGANSNVPVRLESSGITLPVNVKNDYINAKPY